MKNQIDKIWFENESIFIQATSGEKRSHPLNWFPKLLNASDQERLNYKLSPFGIHWENLDEDLSFEGFFSYSKQ
jgi:hypothetical protein